MPATKVTDPVAENATHATQPIASAQNILRPPRFTHASQCHFKKGPFHEKLSQARQLFATTAIVIEVRLSRRRSLTRQGDIHRLAALRTLLSKKARLARGFFKKNRAVVRTSALPSPAPSQVHFAYLKMRFARGFPKQHCPLLYCPCKSRKMSTAPQRVRTARAHPVASKTTFCAQGQHFEREPSI